MSQRGHPLFPLFYQKERGGRKTHGSMVGRRTKGLLSDIYIER